MRDIRLCLGQYEQRLTPDADARISDPPDLSDQTVGAAASPLAAAAPGPPAAPGTDGARVRRWRLLGLVVVVLALAVPTAVQTLPSLPQIGHQVAPNDGDPLFVTWTLAWEAHAVVHEPADLFAANIFYPRRDAVAWSDNLLVLMPVYALAAVVSGGNMVMAYNIVTFLGFLGVGLAVYALGVELLDDRRSALIAATLFSLSMTRSLSVGHTQLVGFLVVGSGLRCRRRGHLVGHRVLRRPAGPGGGVLHGGLARATPWAHRRQVLARVGVGCRRGRRARRPDPRALRRTATVRAVRPPRSEASRVSGG
jgi:hypothetical protein